MNKLNEVGKITLRNMCHKTKRDKIKNVCLNEY